MKLLTVCCLLLSALCLCAELAFKWTVEVSQPLPYAAEALQGESFNLEAKVVQYRVPMLEAAEATFYYQTPEMEASQWYTVPAAWDATTATASVAFTPSMDVGSTKYRFFFGIETAQGKNYRVFGTLRLKASPGFSPATLTPTDVRAEIIQEILKAVFEESDERYATKAEHAALAVQVQGKADASHTHTIAQVANLQAQLNNKASTATVSALTTRLTTAEAAIEEVADAKQDKLTIDAALSFNSTNPVQNHVITRELHNVSGTSVKFNENPSAGFEEFKEGGGRAFKFLAENDHSMEMGIKEGKIAWTDGNGTKREMVLDEGGGAEGLETWADDGTAGIDPSKTFVGVDASHVFHANGQIHGAQMLSADTNKRLYVPFDLMQNDEERWLSAASVWNGNRNIIFNGDTTTLVQPLVPTNKGDNAAYVPYALPCFEDSPIFWKGQMIWHDGTTTLSKSVSIPWSRVTGTTASPSELALKRDIPSVDAALSTTSTNPVQNKAVKTALDGKADAFTVGEGLTLEAGVLKRDSAGTQQWVNETNENYSHYLVNAREDLGDVGFRRAFAFAIKKDNWSNASIIYEDGIYGTQEIPFDIVSRLNKKQDKLTAGENITIENGVISASPAPPTLEVATWSSSVCSVPWGVNPLLIDCTDLEVADVVFSFPIASWPEGAQRTIILRTGAMTDATGTGTLLHAFTQQDATLLTAKIHGYEVFPTGEEIICSAMRLGNTIHLTTTMRSSL